jgi:hypothetical protein
LRGERNKWAQGHAIGGRMNAWDFLIEIEMKLLLRGMTLHDFHQGSI